MIGRCWEAGGAPAYWPWPEILEAVRPDSAARIEARDGEADRERFDHFRDVAEVVWERAAGFKGESKLSTWIFAIAYRKAMKALRRYDAPIEDHEAENRASQEDSPEQAFGQTRLHNLLRVAMSELSPEHRGVVELTYFNDLSYREIAEIMGCPVDTVKTRMFYARRHLKRRLDGELPDWI